jgi:hypothetical protein
MESHSESESETQPPERPPKSGRARRRFRLGAIILLYLLSAYVLIQLAWKRQFRRHPELFDGPRVTHTSSGVPDDPVNVALIGTESGRTSDTKSVGSKLNRHCIEPLSLHFGHNVMS